MTTRYTEKQIEDVARILIQRRAPAVEEGLGRSRNAALTDVANDFASLFAAANPPACIDCGAHHGEPDPEGQCLGHLFAGGFNRADFLAACGLESEG